MRNIIIFAALAIALGMFVAQNAGNSTPSTTVGVAATAPSKPSASKQTGSSSGARIVNIERDSRGHFQVRARVEGRELRFMVDTGASVIALTERDADQIGIRPRRDDFTVNVSTANGTVKAARVKLRSVDINGLKVDDVSALVLPKGALSENLLGLSYLSRLKRYEFAGTRLVMEQ